MTVNFQQAAIKVEKAQEFARLQAAVERAFLPEKAEQFLKQLDRKGIRVRISTRSWRSRCWNRSENRD
jgi:hypothetical protein